MQARRILLLQGHPDPAGGHFGHALAAEYSKGAAAANHEVRRMEVAKLDFPLLHCAAEWTSGKPPAAIAPAQADLLWAQHIVIFFPLWLGDMPAVLKGFFEQLLRPGFAFDERERGMLARKRLTGRSARVVVTMGMPSNFYSLYYRAHSVKSLSATSWSSAASPGAYEHALHDRARRREHEDCWADGRTRPPRGLTSARAGRRARAEPAPRHHFAREPARAPGAALRRPA